MMVMDPQIDNKDTYTQLTVNMIWTYMKLNCFQGCVSGRGRINSENMSVGNFTIVSISYRIFTS